MTKFMLATGVTTVVIVAICLTTTGSMRGWLTAATLCLYLIQVGLGVSLISLQFFGPAICRGKRGKKQAALTFDDGPDPGATPVLLDVLDEYGVRATFFCIGKNVVAQPELARRILTAGHILGNHSFHHAWWTNFLFGRWLRREIEQAQQVIEQATGVKPRYFRPPMGLTNPHFKNVLYETALTMVGWDVRTYDKKNAPEDTVAKIMEKTRDGSIIAMHDGGVMSDNLIAAVTGAITALQAKGFEFVQLSEFLETS